jgi:hypothetical protein
MKCFTALAFALLTVSHAALALGPCCAVIGIDARTGVITAKETATGRSFTFRLKNPNEMRSLRPGQPVYANFAASEVSLDGQNAGGQIIGMAAPMAEAGSIRAAATVERPVAGIALSEVQDKKVDPCKVAGADVLKGLLKMGLQQMIPPSINNGGKHLDFSNPSILQVTCPNLSFQVQIDVQYRETRGFPQFQTGGSMVLESSLIGDLQYSSVGGATAITAADLRHATAVLVNPQITSLKIDGLPSWLVPAWIRECLNGQHADWGCKDVISTTTFDISQYVLLNLQQGSTL